jgi:hypothetical protein
MMHTPIATGHDRQSLLRNIRRYFAEIDFGDGAARLAWR